MSLLLIMTTSMMMVQAFTNTNLNAVGIDTTTRRRRSIVQQQQLRPLRRRRSLRLSSSLRSKICADDNTDDDDYYGNGFISKILDAKRRSFRADPKQQKHKSSFSSPLLLLSKINDGKDDEGGHSDKSSTNFSSNDRSSLSLVSSLALAMSLLASPYTLVDLFSSSSSANMLVLNTRFNTPSSLSTTTTTTSSSSAAAITMQQDEYDLYYNERQGNVLKNVLLLRRSNAYGSSFLDDGSQSLSISSSLSTSSDLVPLNENQQLINDIWFAITAQYYDPTYNGMGENGWRQVRNDAITLAGENPKKLTSSQAKSVIDDMISKLNDPYTKYLPQEQYDSITSYTKGGVSGVGAGGSENDNSAGIGVQLLLSSSGGSGGGDIMVMNVVKDGPAFVGGIRSGDVIIEVDGTTVRGTTAEYVASKCRGADGTKVKLTVSNTIDGKMKKRSVILTRSNSINTKLLNSVKQSTFVSDYSGFPVGLLRIPAFTQTTTTELKQALQELLLSADERTGDNTRLSSIVIDVRGNVGGYMPAGIEAASIFLPPRAAIVAEIDSSGSGTYYMSPASSPVSPASASKKDQLTLPFLDKSIPLYIAVDSKTASAAEIFVAAMKENRRAYVVSFGDEHTFGKGRIQNIQSLGNGNGGIAVTKAKYITPSGKDIHNVGIKPNKVLSMNNPSCTTTGSDDPSSSIASCMYGII